MPEDQQQEASDPFAVALKTAVDFLKTKGVTRIAMDYNGYGDSGSFGFIRFIEQPRKIDAPGQEHPENAMLLAHQLSGVSAAESPHQWQNEKPTVEEVIEDYAYRLLANRHPGWEINEGSTGEMFVDLHDGTVTHSHGAHYQHTEWSEHESTL
jgi:hypothetical protein